MTNTRRRCARCRRYACKRPTVKTPLALGRKPHDRLCVDCAPASLDAFRPVSQGQVSALHAKCNTLALQTDVDRDEWKRRVKVAAAEEFELDPGASFKELTYEQASWSLDWLDERTRVAA